MESRGLNPAVILCMTATGLAIARSLGRRGVTVYGVDGHRFEIGHRSRYVKRSELSYLNHNDAGLADRLIGFAEKHFEVKPVLYIAGDEYFSVLANDRERLGRSYIMPDGYLNGDFIRFLDKEQFYVACDLLNLDIPRTLYCDSSADLREITSRLDFPMILKPRISHEMKDVLKGKKVFVAKDPDELEYLWATFANELDKLLIQEVIPGGDDCICQLSVYIDKDGNALDIMSSQKMRQHPSQFGIGSMIRTRWIDELVERGLMDLAALKFKGICDVEYKYDMKKERWRLIEVNPRVGMYFSLCEIAGVNIIWNSYCDLIGRDELAEKSGPQREGITWQYLARDLPAVAAKIVNGSIGCGELIEFVKITNRTEPILNIGDIACGLYYPAYIFNKLIQFR